MSDPTAPRIALVTGGSKGIGRAVAIKLASEGMTVVVNYANDNAAAQTTARLISEAGGHARAVKADIADEKAVATLFDHIEHEFGGIDVVINSAGRMTLSPIADLDLEALDAMHRTNIRGTFVVAREAARRLRRSGAFIGLSTSIVGLQLPGYGAYAASKAATEGLLLILARELRGRDITVNAVAPGPTATELFLDGKTDEQIAAFAKQPPLERLGTPDDIASVVAFLAGPAGRWVNGQVLRANGGAV